MSEPNSALPNLVPIIDCGSSLAKLLHETTDLLRKTRDHHGSARGAHGSTNQDAEMKNRLESIGDEMSHLLRELNKARGQIVEESVSNVIRKIEATFQDLIKLDPAIAAEYEQLAQKVKGGFKPLTQSLEVESSSQYSTSAFIPQKEYSDSEGHDDRNDERLPDLGSLENEAEKLCLLWFSLFPDAAEIKRKSNDMEIYENHGVGIQHSGGTEIKKRELINWWIGMDVIEPGSDGGKGTANQILAKLVEEGFIERAVKNKKVSNIYRMTASVRSSVINQAPSKGWSQESAQEGSFYTFSMMRQSDGSNSDAPPQQIKAAINIRERNMDAKRLESLLKLAKNAQVVHLGSWCGDKDYIVVEDTGFLRALKNLESVKFLSLQGVSGIVQLPDLVCNLKNLKVLDLRACNNLELLPENIGFLRQLAHLDLSECFLLNHVPEGVTSLSELRVLKGFIINPESEGNAVPSSYAFSKLSDLTKLCKLTIRTRRMNFPTTEDLETLCKLKQLQSMKITWVGSSNGVQIQGNLETFPKSLKKLELQAAPEGTTLQLFKLIGQSKSLRELYIKGGELHHLGPRENQLLGVMVVRLRHLPKLRVEWPEFREFFPNLTRFEIFKCPHLVLFPCGKNGVWEKPL